MSQTPVLTIRQRQVLRLVRKGMANKEIAYELGLTTGTVKAYMVEIFDRVGVRNRVELAMRSDVGSE